MANKYFFAFGKKGVDSIATASSKSLYEKFEIIFDFSLYFKASC